MSLHPNKNKIKKRIILESVLVFFVAITPFLFKLYDYFPGPNHPDAHEPISILGIITLGSNGFDSISTNLWFYSGKIIPLMLLIIWFFTSRDWWYHILLIPILMYAFQLFELFFSEDDVIDTENIWWLLPVCMVVTPIVYFIRIKIYDKHVHGIDLEAMEAELDSYKEKGMVPEESAEEIARDLAQLEDETFSEKIDRVLSTRNLENQVKQFNDHLRNWIHLRF